MSNTSTLRGRDQESYTSIDLTGSTGRTLTSVEVIKKTVRFVGTLGQSVTIRLPLSQDSAGVSFVYENQTSGGFSVTIAPTTGTGPVIAPGAAISCFFDGTNLVGGSSAAATGLPATVGGAVTVIPIVVTTPTINDVIVYNGSSFVNSPGGSGIGSPVASGTVGSVLFVGATSLLAQDNANFFWDDPNNRLGLGTNAPNARLHVLDNVNDTVARIHGESLFASVFVELGQGSQASALRVYPGQAASGGNTFVETGGVIVRAHYWSGAASLPVDGWIRMHVTAATPTYYTAIGVNASDRIFLRQDGQLSLGSTVPNTNGGITQSIVLLGTMFINGLVTIGDTVNVALGTGTGTKWGTAASQLQGWWGQTPVARGAITGATTDQRLDSLLALLAGQANGYGLIEPYANPLLFSPFFLLLSTSITGADGSAVSTWPDTSGNNNSPTAAGSLRPTLQVNANTSPTGLQLVRFDGIDDLMGLTVAMPSAGAGWTVYVYGNIRSLANSQTFTDNTFQRPQLINSNAGKYAFRDQVGTFQLTNFAAGFQTQTWVFTPPAGTGLCELFINGVSQGAHAWNFNPSLSTGFFVGGGTVTSDADFGVFALFPTAHDTPTRQAVERWIKLRYG